MPRQGGFDLNKMKDLLRQAAVEKQVHELHSQNYELERISEIVNVPVWRVEYIIQLGHLSPKERSVIDAYQNGMSINLISRRLKISVDDIHQLLLSMGMEHRSMLPQTPKKKLSKKLQRRPHHISLKERVQGLCRDSRMGYQEISDLTNVPRRTVNTWCKGLRGAAKVKPTPEVIKKINYLRRKGHTWKEIATKLKLAISTVKDWYKRGSK